MQKPQTNLSETLETKQGAYLLRYWRDQPGEPLRFMLRAVATNERELFGDWPSLRTRLNELLVDSIDGDESG